MKKIFSLLLLSIFILSSCSDDKKDYEPEPPITLETDPIATFYNNDGTYYTLHEEFVRLRNADGTVIAEHELKFPDEQILQLPYGEQITYYYIPSDFFVSESNVLVCFTPSVGLSLPTDETVKCIAYVFNKILTAQSSKQYVYGFYYRPEGNKIFIFDNERNLYVYDLNFNLLTQKPCPTDATFFDVATVGSAVGEYQGKYYAMGCLNSYNYSSEEYIVNYTDGKTCTVYKPLKETIISTYFPSETSEPRCDKVERIFKNGEFTITYFYKKYNGEQVEIKYIYDTQGNQIFPVAEPEKYYIECDYFKNSSGMVVLTNEDRDPDDCYISENNYQIYLQTGAEMQVSAFHDFYGRHEEVEFDVVSSDDSKLRISKSISRSYTGDTQFRLTPFEKGIVDITFTNPQLGEIETWHINIIDKPE